MPEHAYPDQRLGMPGPRHGECGARGDRHRGRTQHSRRQPAEGVPLRHGEHGERHRDGDEQRAPHVEPVADARVPQVGGVAEDLRRAEGGDQPDGDVDEEDGTPVRELDEHPAEDLPGDEAQRRGGPVQPERAAAFAAFGESRGDEGQRGGHDDGRTYPLHDAGGEQQHRVPGEAAGQRGEGERDQPDHEHPAPAEHVGGPPAKDQQAAEGDGVGGDHPVHHRCGQVQLALDRRQGHIHNAEVE